MSIDSNNLHFRPIRVQDLELLIAWRSNPDIYEQFKMQDAPLDWDDHITWFSSRSDSRHDYMIEYNGRRVGSVYISENRRVGVYIGESSLIGNGIGTRAIEWITEKFSKPLYAEIHTSNKASQKVFEKCGFEQTREIQDWIEYKLI